MPSKSDSIRREPLNRDRVVAAAIELADEGGLDAITMRTLGDRLGVKAASLYNHVSGKEDVLEGMTDWATAQIDTSADDGDWRAAMRRRAVSARACFERHAWAGPLIDSRHQGPATIEYADRVLGVLLGAGFSATQAANAFVILDSYIYGFERQRSVLAMGDDEASLDAAQEVVDAIPESAFPALMTVAGEFATRPFDEDTAFELGLRFILDGLEAMLAETRRAAL